MFIPLDKTDKKLRNICPPISPKELRSEKVQNNIDALLDFVYGRSNKGKGSDRSRPMTIGLSANQVGVMRRISIVDFAIRRREYSDVHVFINPKIVKHSKTTKIRWEGCVNLPGIWGEVPRYIWVVVRAFDRWGSEYVIKAKGWQAVLLQHEIDHLNGILFIDRLKNPTRAHLVKEDQYKVYKKEKKNWKIFTDVSKLKRAVPGEGLEPT